MAEITWIKLKVDMFDNDKIKLIEALPDADTIIVIWIKLLTAAGKANMNGYIMLTENIPMNVEEMATIFGRPLNTVRLALETFRRYGMIEVDENDAVRIANWEKHQNIDGMDRVRKLNAERNKRYRERKKQQALQAPNDELKNNSDVTLTSRDGTDKDLDLDKDLDIEKDIDKDKDTEKENSVGRSGQSSLVDMNFLLIQDAFRKTIREPKPQDLLKMDEALEFYEPNLILEAIKEAKSRRGKSFAYVLGILDNWRRDDDIKNFEDWKVKKSARTQCNQRQNGKNHGGNETKIPADIDQRLRNYTSPI